MKSLTLGMAAALMAASLACSKSTAKEPDALSIPTGSDVTLEKRDGVKVSGRLVEVQAQDVVLELRDGQRTRVARADIAALRGATLTAAPSELAPTAPPAAPAESSPRRSGRAASPSTANNPAPERPAAPAPPPAPVFREVTVPAGTALAIELRTTVGSATSNVEDQVRGTIRQAVTIEGVEAIPAGSTVVGSVTEAERSGRVKGLARVAFRFSALDLPGDAERISIRTHGITREAEATKKKDATKIGGGAAAGAVIGGILGGGDGAAKGAAIGGAAGTGVVLSTRGKEVTVPAGTSVSTRLTEPITLRVRIER
jgi:hypothetical protein